MLPFIEMPRPLQESGVIGKGGAAGFLGKAFDLHRLYQDPNKPIDLGDLALRSHVSPERLKDRFSLLKGINGSMPELEKAASSYVMYEYYQTSYNLVLSGKERNAFDLEQEKPKPGKSMAGPSSDRERSSPGVWWKPARASCSSTGR